MPSSAAASATAGPALRDRSRAPASARILIVEDDVSLGKFLSRALKQKLFSVEVSLDGEAAWEALQNSIYDLVILDLNLPRMDGMELLKRVRLTQPALRMLVLTARNRTEDMVLALEQGADDCLIKPFSFLELLARIRGLLRRGSSSAVSSSKLGDLSIDREQHRVVRGDAHHRSDAARVCHSGVPDGQRRQNRITHDTHARCMEHSVRSHHQHRRRLHEVSTRQDRHRGRSEIAPHRSWRGVRPKK